MLKKEIIFCYNSYIRIRFTYMKQLSILCLIIMVSCQTNQDHTQAKIQIDTLDIARHMEALASDDFQGRKPFTVGEVKTVDYHRWKRNADGDHIYAQGKCPSVGQIKPALI